MRTRLGLGLGLALALGIAGGAAPTLATEFHSGKEITLNGDHSDLVFLSGGKLAIGAKVMDDIFASGGELNYEGAGADHVITAGGDINFKNVQVKDIIAAGGHIRIDGSQIADDVVIMGGEINIASDSRVASSAVIAGGDITIAGTIGGDVTIRGGEVRIDGTISGNVDITAHEIRLGPKAVIEGTLKHRTADLIVEPGATIKGEITALPYDEEGMKKTAVTILLIASVVGLLILAGMGICTLVVAGLFAGHMQGTDRAIRSKFFSTLLIGILATIGLPVLCVLFLATVIGIPLALVLLAFWLAVQPLAFAAVAHATGMAIRSGFGGERAGTTPGAGGRMAYALLGLAILVVLGVIPFVGHIVWLLVGILGLGATVRELYRVLARPDAG